jgi:hypothetical protein
MENKYSIDYLLSGDDVLHIAGPNTIILNYPQLYEYQSIEQLFSNGIEKIILLYLTDRDDINMSFSGHWVSITKRNNHIVFFDPYGYMPDSEIKFNKTNEKREFLNQNSNYLTRLLYDYCKKGGIIEYNQMRFQKHGRNINSCGRHAAFQARFYDIPLDYYQKVFKDLRKKGWNLDDVIVFLTNQFL